VQKISPGAGGVASDERRDLALSFISDRHAAPLAAQARCYSFHIGPWSFLLEEGQFAELISQPVYTPLPNTPQHCLGLANVRGNIVPFYALHVFVPGVQRPSREQLRYALLLGDTVDGVLLAIDGKPLPIGRDQLVQGPPPTSKFSEPVAHFIQQAYRYDNRDWLMISCDKLTQFLLSAGAE
jgi:chemotaxis signal transduction protein